MILLFSLIFIQYFPQFAHFLAEDKYSSSPLLAHEVKVTLGANNQLKSSKNNKNIHEVITISVHPDWYSQMPSFDADFAVLELSKDIQFTIHIQLVFLIKPKSGFPLNKTGFRRNKQSHNFEAVTNAIEIPVVSYRDCSKSVNHRPLISHRTICGVYANDGLIVE